LLNLGDFGGGILAEFDASYRLKHFQLGVNLFPVGVASATNEDTLTTWSSYLYGTFDTWLFGAGLGLGAQAVNDTDFLTETGSGLGFLQILRIGAVDGLHLSTRTRAVVFHSQTEFAGLDMQGQIAVASDAWLIFRGGGGTSGYGFGEVVVRNLLRGNGLRDSMFLEVSIGGAALLRESCPQTPLVSSGVDCGDHLIGGPLVGLGGEWRF
jgi:hypothetical protein